MRDLAPESRERQRILELGMYRRSPKDWDVFASLTNGATGPEGGVGQHQSGHGDEGNRPGVPETVVQNSQRNGDEN